jgi:nicotinamide-nucleotide amidase
VAESEAIDVLAQALVAELTEAGCTVATAESCTGGWIARALTDVAGSSAVFGYGVVSYSNEAKETMLGVNAGTLEDHGAVSEAVVVEMAAGVRSISKADFAVAVSGVAGPDGGSDEKPVGTVWFAIASPDKRPQTERRLFAGDRESVRRQTVIFALQRLREALRSHG